MKFEEAYIDKLNKTLNINELYTMRIKDFPLFVKIHNCLYCPECQKAKLAYVSSEPAYLRSYPNSEHSENCDLKQEELSQKALENYIEEEHSENIENHLKNLAAKAVKSKPPIIQKKNTQDNNENVFHYALLVLVNHKRYRFPQKKIDTPLYREDLNVMKMFYGIVSAKWEYSFKFQTYKLLLYNAETRRMICKIAIKKEVYQQFPNTMKFEEKADIVVAFFSKLIPVLGTHYFEAEIIHPSYLFLQLLK